MNSRKLLWVAAGLLSIGLLGACLWLRPWENKTVPEAARTLDYRLSIADGRLVSGPRTLLAAQGDLLALKLRSAQRNELRIPGYGWEISLQPRHEIDLTFRVDRAGRYTMELDDGASRHEIAELIVEAR